MISYSLQEKIGESSSFGNISPIEFFINILITLILSLFISFIYRKYGKSISNRKEFAYNFPLLSITTMFIISVVKSSLALSLGLVGALSIVRFRSAIKEPEELTYLFISIAIGLGIGANQLSQTIISIFFLSTFIYLRNKFNKKNNNRNLSLMISYSNVDNNIFDSIINIINEYSTKATLQRYSENTNNVESSILVQLDSYTQLRDLQKRLSTDFPDLNFDFIDNSIL